jgi:hypothetical protein
MIRNTALQVLGFHWWWPVVIVFQMRAVLALNGKNDRYLECIWYPYIEFTFINEHIRHNLRIVQTKSEYVR